MQDIPTEQQHPEESLPWYVNGTLNDEEREAIEQHLVACTQCQQEIALLQQMRSHIKETQTHSPGEFGLNRLLGQVRNTPTASKTQTDTSSRWWQVGFAIAASFIIFVQAGLLIDTWYLSKPIIPLSGPQEHGHILQVSFAPTTTESQMREVLRAIQGRFIDGPSSLGIYRIQLDNMDLATESSIESTIHYLQKQHTIILHVTQE